MSEYVIGIDPDSKKHGVATYEDGKLTRLDMFNLIELMEYLNNIGDIPVINIEDNVSVSAAYGARDKKGSQHVKLKMAQHIGMCKQAQIEVERLCEYLGLKVVKRKQSKQWKKNKEQFESVTGWEGRSNEDTRSAAYFGYLGL